MDISTRYAFVMSEIEKGHRALVRFSSEDVEVLLSALESNPQEPELEKILCLIEHSASLSLKFEAPLLHLLNADHSVRIKVFALNCARRHVIQGRMQKGQRLTYDFLESLKKLLHSPSPELVEWTLRTIEECGNQGVYFLREFDRIKPAPWKWFNPHQRAVREIIALLERRWSRFERSQS